VREFRRCPDQAYGCRALRLDEREPVLLDRPDVAGGEHDIAPVPLLRDPQRALGDPQRSAAGVRELDQIAVRQVEHFIVAIVEHR